MALACLNKGAIYAPRHARFLVESAHRIRRLQHRTVLPKRRWQTRTENLLRDWNISCWYLWGLNGIVIFANPADLDFTVYVQINVFRQHLNAQLEESG